MKKKQIGGSMSSTTSSDELNPYKMKSKVAPNSSFVPPGSMNKMQRGGGTLTKAELDALSHQRRGMGTRGSTFVKKAGSIKNDLGHLTQEQQNQLKQYMGKAGTAKKIYEGLPNIGRYLGHGNSAADIPKGSQLEKQRKGGSIKKMKK
mgnify:CR=1 FL=1